MYITIPKTNYEHAVFVANRDSLNINAVKEEDNGITIDIKLSSDEEKEIFLEDIDCEIQRAKTSHHTPVYSANTLYNNPEKARRLRAFYGTNSFQLLKKDIEI